MNEISMNKIICADALEFMKKIPDKSIDLCLTDPDYNAKSIGPKKRKYEDGIMQMPPWKYKNFCLNWFFEALRISKTLVFTPGIVNTHNYTQPKWMICWHKPAARSFNKLGGFNCWEPIFIYGEIKGDLKKMGQDYILSNTLALKKGPEKDHPCPKPPRLWSKLIQLFSEPGQIVLDPFMGSGTTAKCCQELGRNFIGCDKEEYYCQIGRERLAEQPLFAYLS